MNPLIALQGQVPSSIAGINSAVQAAGNTMRVDQLRGQGQQMKKQWASDDQIRQIKSASIISEQILPFLESGDVQKVESILNQTSAIDPELSAEGLQLLKTDPAKLGEIAKQAIDLNKKINMQTQAMPSGLAEFEGMTRGLTQEDRERARRIELGLDARAGVTSANERIAGSNDLTGAVASSQAEIEGAKSGASEAAKLNEQLSLKPQVEAAVASATGKARGRTDRAQTTIQEGKDAAQGIAVLKRSIGLLDEVKTGGYANAAFRARQFFGVEGADEGELSANLGQAILGDLRKTFGAQFTEREGARLERIRANFGKNASANKRLLQQALQIAEDSATRAMKQAADDGDYRTAQEIQELINFEFQFEEKPGIGDTIITPEEKAILDKY